MDVKLVEALVALMNANDLAEVEVEQDGHRVRLRKRCADAPVAAAPMMMAAPSLAPAPVAAAAIAPAAPAVAATPAGPPAGEAYVRSPIVGTFYRAASPDASPFIDVGDRVSKDSVVCIVEAMKVMNEIKADVMGVVTAVLVENGEPVEFGQPLFSVKTV
jgi:acetyl-CoA carboxylase biotin carboxyl carrier protein